ncbi:Retrovirus-related Pol polyprotein from transposon TNT 1-94 [Bienertia sinuspersici]
MTSKKTNNSSSNIDTSSPLYLHPNEGNLVISEKLQGISNFRPWKRSMEIALGAKRKLAFVIGAIVRDKQDTKLQEQWDTCNNVVINWLHNSMSETIKKSVLYYSTAREIWVQLERRFTVSNGSTKYRLNKEIYEKNKMDYPLMSTTQRCVAYGKNLKI